MTVIEMHEPQITLDEQALASIFEEWDRRWRENPQEFMDLVTHFTKNTPLTYGQACAPYFVKLAVEFAGGQP
jgi:hypothetical protein